MKIFLLEKIKQRALNSYVAASYHVFESGDVVEIIVVVLVYYTNFPYVLQLRMVERISEIYGIIQGIFQQKKFSICHFLR